MAGLYRVGGVYYLTWIDKATGKQRRKSLRTKDAREAKRLRLLKEAELETGHRLIHTGSTFADFVRDSYLPWRAGEHPSSQQRIEQICEQYLIPFFGTMALSEITVRAGDDYKTWRRDAKVNIERGTKLPKESTLGKEIRTLKAIISRAVAWGELAQNDLKELKAPKGLDSKAVGFYSKEQLEHLYETDPAHAHWWRFLVNTGLRRGELIKARFSDVRQGSLHVESVQGDRDNLEKALKTRTKSGKRRWIPLSKSALEALAELQAEADERDVEEDRAFLFPRILPRSFSRVFERAVERAELPGSLHWTRHTFCSHLVMKRVPLRTVQALAGHASIVTTEAYSHLCPEHTADAARLLDL